MMCGFVYATKLPTGLIKVGRGIREDRARAAQTFFAEPVEVVGCWPVTNRYEAERVAHNSLGEWRVGSTELFNVSAEECVFILHRALIKYADGISRTWRMASGELVSSWDMLFELRILEACVGQHAVYEALDNAGVPRDASLATLSEKSARRLNTEIKYATAIHL